ncbi:MAG: hypothetical protein ACRCS6_03495, partial [Turicibacter sp.]
LVDDVIYFTEYSEWQNKLGGVKATHYKFRDINDTLIMNYDAIYQNNDLIRIIFYESEVDLEINHEKLKPILQKSKPDTEIPLHLFYNADFIINTACTTSQLRQLKEDFYFEVFRIGRYLKREEVREAKWVEQLALKSYFVQLITWINREENLWRSAEKFDRSAIDIELKECLNNFYSLPTWERLQHFMLIFDTLYNHISLKREATDTSYKISTIKSSLNLMYEESQQEKNKMTNINNRKDRKVNTNDEEVIEDI